MSDELIADLITQLENSKTVLFNSFEGITNKIFTDKSKEVDWSIAQIVEHVILAEKGIIESIERNKSVLNPKTISHKLNETMIGLIATPGMKAKSPEPFIPNGKFNSKSEGIVAFEKHRKWLASYIEAADINWDHFGFYHFLLGQLNCKDSINFINGHCMRHAAQIRNILINKVEIWP